MRTKAILIILLFFFASEINPVSAKPRRSKSCVQKVLLPGHSKPIKCSKARKVKNRYF